MLQSAEEKSGGIGRFNLYTHTHTHTHILVKKAVHRKALKKINHYINNGLVVLI